jgi:hypothetical protein
MAITEVIEMAAIEVVALVIGLLQTEDNMCVNDSILFIL